MNDIKDQSDVPAQLTFELIKFGYHFQQVLSFIKQFGVFDKLGGKVFEVNSSIEIANFVCSTFVIIVLIIVVTSAVYITCYVVHSEIIQFTFYATRNDLRKLWIYAHLFFLFC